MSAFRDRLARVLQSSVPEARGSKLVWRGNAIYGAKGIWRQKRMDVCSWSATAVNLAGNTVLHVDCWETMGECIKAGRVGTNEKCDLVWPEPLARAISKAECAG